MLLIPVILYFIYKYKITRKKFYIAIIIYITIEALRQIFNNYGFMDNWIVYSSEFLFMGISIYLFVSEYKKSKK